ncbi:MAG TPA: ferritin-like domain-containing protein [Acidimicrobiales bacterium]|nr:ferritin-like domain-containing protein [Acidimicrobiales bacterium]
MTHRTSHDTFDGSERELEQMTVDLHELHHDVGTPAMAAATSAMIDAMGDPAPRRASRRSFLIGTGAAVAGGAALAFAGAAPVKAGAAVRGVASFRQSAAFPPHGLKGDLAVAAVAASLENLAVFAYDAALSAAGAGKLGSVPPAVATFATTVKGQHQEHADAWNAVLRAAGKAKVTVTNPTLTPTVQSDFAKVTDIASLAKLALTLETIAAQTYQAETSQLKSKAAIGLSSSIQPVEMQHIAILYYVLGMYPGAQTSSGTPLAFNPTSQAV